MEKGAVKKSIEKYEHKKEFREVKLKTRQSFREDQVALERRLSTYRPDFRPRMSSSGTENGAETKSDENGNDMSSKLESIVLDIKSEKGEEIVNSTDIVDYKNTTIKQEENGVNGLNGDIKVNGHAGHVNGAFVHENGGVPNGNGSVPNGHPPIGGSLGRKPNGHLPAGSMTPEPRLKLSGRRIYEKNPRLTAASTEHLDNISLKGFKLNNPAHGLRLVDLKQQHQQTHIVPTVPSMPIAAIPPDGNLRGFNVDEMVTIFRMLSVREDILLRLSVNRVDGNRFSAFTDKDLESLGICNPVAKYFRDRSSVRKKKGPVFML